MAKTPQFSPRKPRPVVQLKRYCANCGTPHAGTGGCPKCGSLLTTSSKAA